MWSPRCSKYHSDELTKELMRLYTWHHHTLVVPELSSVCNVPHEFHQLKFMRCYTLPGADKSQSWRPASLNESYHACVGVLLRAVGHEKSNSKRFWAVLSAQRSTAAMTHVRLPDGRALRLLRLKGASEASLRPFERLVRRAARHAAHARHHHGPPAQQH